MITRELFEDVLTWTREHGSIPRISAVCTDNGQEIFSGGRGHRAHAETRYPIASITKTFTAFLVQQALSEKNWDLQNPVHDLLSIFHLRHPRSASLTSADLMNHQSPMAVHLWAWLFGEVDRRTFVEERLPNLECHPDKEPRYRYSNIMYAVLGLLVEELTAATWETALQNMILDPLGMDQTFCIHPGWHKTPHLAPPMKQTPHGEKSMPPFFARENHPVAPASELISSARDLTLWAQHANRIRPWQTDDPVLLRRSRPGSGLEPLYSANGWRMEAYGKHTLFWHTGQCSGYTGILACIPDRNFTLAVLCNLDGAVDSLQALMYSTADLACSHPAKNWFETLPAPEPKEETKPDIRRATALPPSGLYTNSGYGGLEMDPKGNVLFQKTAEGYLSEAGLYFPLQNKTFQTDFPTASSPALVIHFEPDLPGIPFLVSP